MPTPTLAMVEIPASVIDHPVLATATTPDSKLPSPINCCAVTTPVALRLVASNTVNVDTPDMNTSSVTNKSVVDTTPLTFAVPLTSRNSPGIDVPIPTRPFASTMKLSLSTWTPLRKLKDFL